jgi:2-oxoglutarate dehydrogenase E2 component (dihydrolipoamide succinyltransferase)
MTIEVRVPALPESVTEASVIAWRKQPGEAVKRDEALVDIETDKVVFEVPAPADGILAEIRKQDGASVMSEEVLALIALAGAATGAKSQDTAAAITTPPVTAPAPPHSVAPTAAAAPTPAGVAAGERRVPMSKLRARIAERLVAAQRETATLTTFNEVNLAALQALRTRHKEAFEKQHGTRLGLMSFFVKASVAALKRFPVLNASVEGGDIVHHDYFNIGIAVGAPRGLVVPVLRDADRMGLADIERAIADFGARAQEGRLTLEELTGGTFTISNGGVYGSMLSTPILNPPQSAILGMHRTQDRPIAENGAVVIRPMMYLALSYDHRIIDGREAVQGLTTIKDALEDPASLALLD